MGLIRATLRPIEQRVAVCLQAKVKGTAQVDVGMRDRSDAREVLLTELVWASRDQLVDPSRVPVDRQIGDEGQPSGDRSQLLAGTAVGDTDRPGMDRPLQAMDRFALGQQGVDGPAEVGMAR